MSKVPTFGSLFAGIGGIDLGLERAGWECKWQVEWDDFCTKVLERHWPNVKRYGDCQSIEPKELGPIDLLCGGFPCQAVSTSGHRKGELDSRWLWPEFHRFIRGLKPEWVLAENVPGLLSIDFGRVFGRILRDLAKSRYHAEWGVLSAASFGAPHLRERVFLVAHAMRLRTIEGAHITTSVVEASKAWGANQPFLRIENGRLPYKGIPSNLRMDDGLSYRLDSIGALGNAVVPQVAEWIGRRILECME